ncbi:MAG: hypothetical protein DLM60_17860 [Pseudonocardiales bacterium]|nr:MAG: hypothetical protein DLM60_17860 [Pseudonocardiales bacterium]
MPMVTDLTAEQPRTTDKTAGSTIRQRHRGLVGLDRANRTLYRNPVAWANVAGEERGEGLLYYPQAPHNNGRPGAFAGRRVRRSRHQPRSYDIRRSPLRWMAVNTLLPADDDGHIRCS